MKPTLDTVSGKWLSLQNDPVSLPEDGEAKRIEACSIGFDFLFAGQTMTHFGLTGDGLVYLFARQDTAVYYGELSDINISNAICASPRIMWYAYDDIRVSADEQTRIRYHQGRDTLYIRFENMILGDGVTDNQYRWTYDILLAKGGNISVGFGSMELPSEESGRDFGFAFALKGSADAEAFYASDWAGSATVNPNTSLQVDEQNPDGKILSFTYPLACVPPTGVMAQLETTQNLSTSFSGNILLDGDYDGIMVLVSTQSQIAESPVDGKVYTPETYKAGDSIAGCPVKLYGTETSINLENLQPGMDYYLLVYPYNDRCLGGPVYAEAPLSLSFSTPMMPPVVEVAEIGEDFVRFSVSGNEGKDILVGIARQDYAHEENMLVAGKEYAKEDTLFYSEEPVGDHLGSYLLMTAYNGPVEDGTLELDGLEAGTPYYFCFWTEENEGQYTVEYTSVNAYTIGSTPLTFDFSKDRVPGGAEEVLPAGWTSSEGMTLDFAADYPEISSSGFLSFDYVPDEYRALSVNLFTRNGLPSADAITPVFSTDYSALDVAFRVQMATQGSGFALADLSATDTLSVWYREEGDAEWTKAGLFTDQALDYDAEDLATLRVRISEIEPGSRIQLRFMVNNMAERPVKRFSLHSVQVEQGLSCLYPEKIRVDDSLTTHRAIALEWEDMNMPKSSMIYCYREAGSGEWSGFLAADRNSGCLIPQLASNTLYEIGIQAVCGAGDSSLLKITEASTLRSLPYEQAFTDLETMPEGFSTQYGEFNGDEPVKLYGGQLDQSFQVGVPSSEEHTAMGVSMFLLNRWLVFPAFCLEDQTAPAELSFCYKAYFDQDGTWKDADTSHARLLVLASKDATFSAADIIDTIETGDCSLAYQIYKMDLSSWSRQLHFALVLNNPQMDFNIDNACWFVIDSVRIHYTEGTPCLPVEEVDQPVGGINLV